MPAAADAAVTAISLLTVPASSDASVLAAYAASAPSQQLVPAYLWQHAYSMYGYGSFASNGEVRSCCPGWFAWHNVLPSASVYWPTHACERGEVQKRCLRLDNRLPIHTQTTPPLPPPSDLVY
eukprot:GHRQ01020032.1.p2 GENE.GHRQ01020032.1~~GHRQ01020032.1.p2  ORF type:complete len:123 (+),score=11.99 GHRQ01020032.1:967-1335(+)